MYTQAQELFFPPELKWWIYEIQKEEKELKIDDFKLSDQRTIDFEKEKKSYKNKLFPVLKKWNYYGNQFAYQDIYCSLLKTENGKYNPLLDIDSVFGVFDRNENLIFQDFFGSSKWINTFCWVNDNKIVAVGQWIVNSYGNDIFDVDFVIFEYLIEKKQVKVKEYIYSAKNIDLSKININWFKQRYDYFEME